MNATAENSKISQRRISKWNQTAKTYGKECSRTKKFQLKDSVSMNLTPVMTIWRKSALVNYTKNMETKPFSNSVFACEMVKNYIKLRILKTILSLNIILIPTGGISIGSNKFDKGAPSVGVKARRKWSRKSLDSPRVNSIGSWLVGKKCIKGVCVNTGRKNS